MLKLEVHLESWIKWPYMDYLVIKECPSRRIWKEEY